MKRGFLFNSVPAPKVGRNVFDLSHEFKFSCAMGRLIPLFIQEQIPGDYHRIKPSALVRTQALISPLMHRVDVSTNYFQVPLRILWDGFEDFITGGEDGLQAPEKPYFTLWQLAKAINDTGNLNESLATMYFGPSSLLAYMGVPPKVYLNSSGVPVFDAQSYMDWLPHDHPIWADEKIDALPFRAFYKICYDYFRDQNLDDMDAPLTTSGLLSEDELLAIFVAGFSSEVASDGLPYSRCWKKDYFTSALPNAQRGPEATIPLSSGTAPVYGTGNKGLALRAATDQPGTIRTVGSVSNPGNNYLEIQDGSAANGFRFSSDSQIGNADLSQVSPIGIIALRNAFKLQQFLERNNIAGGRYIESVLAHFGVKSPDRRLQRPAYLGGSSTPIVISEIETNANGQGETDNVVGDLAGKGKMFGNLGTASCFATEHCYVIGLFSVMPVAAYSQGLPRMFSRFDKFDYAWPEFQNIGEQSIKNKEIYFHQDDLDGDFGYTPRYADYKYNPDRFAGDMVASLSYWHMGRIFATKPNLNALFVHSDPTDRIFAVLDEQSSQHIIADVWIAEKAARPFQKYGLPSIS